MREFKEQAHTYDIGFEVGYDLFRYGRSPEDDWDKAVLDGYRAASTAKASIVRIQDPFDKKLLQIRHRAYRKGIDVTITADDLRQAYDETGGVCFTTKKTLTMATGEDTDWSVDRLDNDVGYAPGNIVVMSSFANKAKDDITLEDLMRYVCLGDGVYEELERFEKFNTMPTGHWVRMYLTLFGYMSPELVDKTTYRMVTESEEAYCFVAAPFMGLLFLLCNTSSLKGCQRLLSKSSIFSAYIREGIISKRDITRLRKVANKMAMRYGGLSDTIENNIQESMDFTKHASIRDIIGKLLIALRDHMLEEVSPMRMVIMNELFNARDHLTRIAADVQAG